MSEISATIVWSDGNYGGNSTWFYTSADPYCVHVVFHDLDGEDVPWQISREVLIGGLNEPTGVADLRTWVTGRRYYLGMSSSAGDATLDFHVGDIRNFLRKTRNLVPTGRESRIVEEAADAFLHQLFSTGGAR